MKKIFQLVAAALMLAAFAFSQVPAGVPAQSKAGLQVIPAVLVVGVTPGSPAAESGIVEGDVITRIDGEQFHSMSDFVRFTRRAPGSPVTFEIHRTINGRMKVFQAALQTR